MFTEIIIMIAKILLDAILLTVYVMIKIFWNIIKFTITIVVLILIPQKYLIRLYMRLA
jgi:hypothetical protein